jgi:hypothetical protein
MTFSRDNHYVPRLYLKQFASASREICAYRLVVSHSQVPAWRKVRVAQIGYRTDLYTQMNGEEESDAMEGWFGKEFETPAADAIRRATSGEAMSCEDWRRLIRFTAAQIVRTPAFLVKGGARWEKTLPKAAQATLTDLKRELAKRRRDGGQLVAKAPSDYAAGLPFNVLLNPHLEAGQVEVKIEMLIGRQLWFWEAKRLLSNAVSRLQEHHWTILQPASGLLWFTSDDPVILLNYRSASDYDFGGGWGNPGSEIFMPLSPMHLLYTRIGQNSPDRESQLDEPTTRIFQKMIAEHAYCEIFSATEDAYVEKLKPRIVSAQIYQQEELQWKNWHRDQSTAEREFRAKDGGVPRSPSVDAS